MAQVFSERQQVTNGLLSALLIRYTMERTAVVVFAGSRLGGHENKDRLLADVGKVAEFQTQKQHHSLTVGV
jgi:hypothetical protein